MNLEEALAKRPADEAKVAKHRAAMEQELEAAAQPDTKRIWRHSDWD